MNRAKALRVLRWTGYPVVYLITFVIGLAVFFPFQTVKQHQLDLFNARQKAGQRLSVEKLEGYWVTGIRAQKIKMTSATGDPSKPVSELSADEVTFRLQLLPLLIGKKVVKFDAAVMGGTLKGSLDLGSKERSVDATLQGLSLGEVTPLTQVLGLPMEGKLSGAVHLQFPEGRASKANGTITLELAEMAVGDGKSGLGLPKFTIGTLPIEGEVKDGTVTISRFSVSGRDLDLQGSGKLMLRDTSLAEAQSDLVLRFRFSDKYKGKDEKTTALLGPRGLLEISMANAKTAEGYFGQSIAGPLGAPRFSPNPLADSSFGKGKK
jgi:type II secretion system protein N